MWGLATLRAKNAEAAAKARVQKTKPLHLPVGFDWPLKENPPFIGEVERDLDKNLVRVETLVVDTSGFGAEDGRPLTPGQLGSRLRELSAKHGPLYLAAVEHKQFQARLGVWKEG